MSWLRKALVHLALSRSDAALVKASGGEPRTVRGMTLDPKMQFLEYQARLKPVDWSTMTVKALREQTDAGADGTADARVRNRLVTLGALRRWGWSVGAA